MIKNGIYKIRNLINGKFYIGSAFRKEGIKGRLRFHKYQLNKGIHENAYLQNAWNKYGSENFIFEIIEIVANKEIILEREQHYLDLYKSYDQKIGYNIHKIAGSALGFKHDEETKKQMSEKASGENNNFYGKKHSKESLEQMSKDRRGNKNARAKLTIPQVNEIRELYKINKDKTNIKELSKIYGITSSNIGKIIRNVTYKDENYSYQKPDNKEKIELANKIREYYTKNKVMFKDLAVLFNTSKTQIGRIIHNKIYK